MSGKKGRSGRKKAPHKQITQYLEDNKQNIPALLDELTSQALAKTSHECKCPSCGHEYSIKLYGGGNIEALKYLLDRHFGKSTQALDVQSKSVIVTGEQLAGLLPLLLERDGRLQLESSSQPAHDHPEPTVTIDTSIESTMVE